MELNPPSPHGGSTMAKVCVEFDAGNGNGEPEPGLKTYAQTIGDGSSLSYNIPHNFGTSDVLYSVRNLATGVVDGEDVTVSVTDNALTLVFAAAPAASSVRVLVAAA